MVGYVSGPGGVYKSIDGGITWKDISPPYTVSQIWGCYFVDEENGFVVGGGCSMDNQTFIKTTNGGLTWQINYGFENQSGMSDIILYEKMVWDMLFQVVSFGKPSMEAIFGQSFLILGLNIGQKN